MTNPDTILMAPDSTDENKPLRFAPIVEAVFDVDCDLPPGLNRVEIESAGKAAFAGRYPVFRRQFIEHAEIETVADGPPKISKARGLVALQFCSSDEKEVVQFRADGFSFNRLAPYSSFDDYLPTIFESWEVFVRLHQPSVIRKLGLRFINRIVVPNPATSSVDLDDYFTNGPRLPHNTGLEFAGFLNQSRLCYPKGGEVANTILAGAEVTEKSVAFTLDIEVFNFINADSSPLSTFQREIDSLRALKNSIFKNSLTPQCLQLFQQPSL